MKILYYLKYAQLKFFHTHVNILANIQYIFVLIAVLYFYCCYSYFGKVVLNLVQNSVCYKQKPFDIFSKKHQHLHEYASFAYANAQKKLNRSHAIIWYRVSPSSAFSVTCVLKNIILLLNLFLASNFTHDSIFT